MALSMNTTTQKTWFTAYILPLLRQSWGPEQAIYLIAEHNRTPVNILDTVCWLSVLYIFIIILLFIFI